MGLALGALAAQDGAFEAHQAQAHTSSAVHNLLAVADCGNDRVQVFDLDALICSDAVAGDQGMPQTCAAPPPQGTKKKKSKARRIQGRIKYLLRKMIETADLRSVTIRMCKEHIKQQFGEDGEAVCREHKALIMATIDSEVNRRG